MPNKVHKYPNYSCMSNLVLEIFQVPLNFSTIAYPCLCSYELVQMDKWEKGFFFVHKCP